MPLIPIAMLIFAYLLGSISTASLVCKILNLPDPRTHGSKNPGATNVRRIAGNQAAVLTLLGDAFKAIIPILIAKHLGLAPTYQGLVAMSAFLGHLFPIYYRFRGGKGVSTLIGCLLALAWPLAIFFVAVWIFIAKALRYSSLAAIIAAALTPLYSYFILPTHWEIITAMCLFLIAGHRQNILNLLQHSEPKI